MKTALLGLSLVCGSPFALAADNFDAPPAELHKVIAEETAHFKPVGRAISGRLEKFAPPTIQLKRGWCYVMVLRLGEGASWSEHARQGVEFTYKPKRGGDGEISGGPGVAGPGGVGSAGCPQRSGTYLFDLIADFGAAESSDKLHDLGSGPYSLQLMSKPTSDKALARDKREIDGQVADMASFKRERIHDACVSCAQERDDCLDGKRQPFVGGCMESYKFCMQRTGITARDCR
ncbi:MAG TPA: hypothetical protein VF334_06025 [Polyangia bacterium]